VPENLLSLLKFCLLGCLYLFFYRVLWAVWNEIKRSDILVPATGNIVEKKQIVQLETRLMMKSPPDQKGKIFTLGKEITVGRASGCHISLPDDTFVSQLHARIFQQDGQPFVEDLGSRNGTYLNGQQLMRPTPMKQGDQLQVGSSVMEVR
jgi:pSer/pThr/pTyr-binding forkhead associated (FHA) protein